METQPSTSFRLTREYRVPEVTRRKRKYDLGSKSPWRSPVRALTTGNRTARVKRGKEIINFFKDMAKWSHHCFFLTRRTSIPAKESTSVTIMTPPPPTQV